MKAVDAGPSPALSKQSDLYPASWLGRVPIRVRTLSTVRADFPFLCPPGTIAVQGEEYDAWVNKNGAVSAILPNGELLGLKPEEFEVTEWSLSQVSTGVVQ